MSAKNDVIMYKNMCERLKTEVNSLRGSIHEKETKWKEIEEKNKVAIDLFRSLCEKILAKDKNEMVLGEEYSWSKLSDTDIAHKAIKSYDNYNTSRNMAIKVMLAKYESQSKELEGLKLSIDRMINNGDYTKAKLKDVITDPTKQMKEDEARKKSDGKLQQADKEGKVKAVVEEDDDFEDVEQELENSNKNIEVGIKHQANKATVYTSDKKNKAKNKIRSENIEKEMYNHQETISKISDNEWNLIKILGATGFSTVNRIKNALEVKGTGITQSQVVTGLRMLLAAKGILLSKKIKIPTGSLVIYKLDDFGKLLYEYKNGEKPKLSEWDKIIRNHDNETHGYGILTLASILNQQGKYESVSVFNRKKQIPVTINNIDYKYEPDILCVDATGEAVFYEYELGTHTKKDFNLKCDKMAHLTGVLKFVTPQKDTAIIVYNKVKDWIKERGIKALSNIKIEITTLVKVKDNDTVPILIDLSKDYDDILVNNAYNLKV
ncbi:hypothetical protein ACTQ2N_05205 [Ruminococcus sp. LCP21S3_E8]